MKSSESISERTADRGKGAFGADQALLNRGIALSPSQDRGIEALPCVRPAPGGFENLQQHRLNDEAVVVIPMELRTIAVKAVALVPGLVFADSVVDAHGVGPLACEAEKCFDRCAEEQPVVEARFDDPACL